MIRQQLFIGAALIAGVAIGFFVQPQPEKAPVAEGEKEVAPERIENKGESASVAALRQRIRELEAQLAQARENDEALVSNAVERLEVARKERRERRPEGPRAWLEELKKNDPARYVQMTNSFARRRQERKERQAAKAAFLSTIDVSHMSAGARKTHTEYQNLLEKREAIEEKLHNQDLSDEERREVMHEMHEIDRELRQSGSSERKILLDEVARVIGLEGEAANELVQTVGDVIEVTEGGRGGNPMPPPPPGS